MQNQIVNINNREKNYSGLDFHIRLLLKIENVCLCERDEQRDISTK
jgi:hypothetical protein